MSATLLKNSGDFLPLDPAASVGVGRAARVWRPERIQIVVPKEDGIATNVLLSAVAETITKQKLYEAEDVRQAIRIFVREHMATLTSQQQTPAR